MEGGCAWQGTWLLTGESVMEPPQRLRRALESGIDETGVFGVLDSGASKEF